MEIREKLNEIGRGLCIPVIARVGSPTSIAHDARLTSEVDESVNDDIHSFLTYVSQVVSGSPRAELKQRSTLTNPYQRTGYVYERESMGSSTSGEMTMLVS
jgi:hypothetical protein